MIYDQLMLYPLYLLEYFHKFQSLGALVGFFLELLGQFYLTMEYQNLCILPSNAPSLLPNTGHSRAIVSTIPALTDLDSTDATDATSNDMEDPFSPTVGVTRKRDVVSTELKTERYREYRKKLREKRCSKRERPWTNELEEVFQHGMFWKSVSLIVGFVEYSGSFAGCAEVWTKYSSRRRRYLSWR